MKKNELLKSLNWNVIIVWQCELKNIKIREFTLNNLVSQLLLQA
jgi:hypothetical protein